MKYYLVDEISGQDLKKIDHFLEENAQRSQMEKIFWIEIPEDLTKELQTDHDQCRPHYFSIELGTDWIRAEFFIRTLSKLRCECNGYANSKQKEFIYRFMEGILGELDIGT